MIPPVQIAAAESEHSEFKERLNEHALETLAAFANGEGGTLVLGVDSRGTPVGISTTDIALQQAAGRIWDALRIQPSIGVEDWQGAKVIVVRARPSRSPVSYQGRYFVRVGNTTRVASTDELGRLFLSKWGVPWDRLTVDGPVDELDADTVRRFVRGAAARLPLLGESEPVDSVLQKLDLVQDGKLTHAALLLFGKNPQRYFAGAAVHVGRFTEGGAIADDKLIGGNLFQQVDATLTVLRQHLRVQYEFTGAPERVERWEYPLAALREAVINAIVHRDYLSTMAVEIRVYDDRLLVWNPGELAGDLTVEELRREPHRSIPPNPTLAQVFYYAGLIERWGTGTTRIIRLCREHQLPEPAFVSEARTFRVEFPNDPFRPERLRMLGLLERQIQAIRYAREHGSITNREYRALCGLSDRAVTHDLNRLVERGLLERTGERGRGVRYRVRGA